MQFFNRETCLVEPKPAVNWNEAFPLGNGRLGAMVFGGLEREEFSLNEETVWNGGPRDRNNPDALQHLQEIRRLIRAGLPGEAEKLSLYTLAGTPESECCYQSLATFRINFNPERPGNGLPPENNPVPDDYRRVLDLDTAVASTTYTSGGGSFRRDHFISAPSNVFATRITADAPGYITLCCRFTRKGFTESSSHERGDTLLFKGSGIGEGAVRFAGGARIVSRGGTCRFLGDHCIIDGADEVVIYIASATSFGYDDYRDEVIRRLDAAEKSGWQNLLDEHVRDYQSFAGRMSLSFTEKEAGASDPEYNSTSLRLEDMKEGREDLFMIPLYLNFGRYLLISSSRPGTLPANLQGIWNPLDAPPWGSKYTININTQMNYWLAEPSGLGECHTPLFDHIMRMIPRGRRTAEVMYGCRGFTAHHNTDLWGDCAPQDHWMPATVWCLGAAWLCLHLIEHYEFTGDEEFREKYYPVLRECALFFEDYLVENEVGELVTSPSVSPENTYILKSGISGRICEGPSMDSQILHELFSGCLDWASRLGHSEEEIRYGEILKKLPPLRIGSDGRILEWREELEEQEPGHRHISHLFALHPGHQIHPAQTPRAALAAEKTIRYRLAGGGGHTGWSRAWILNFWARLGKGREACENLHSLLTGSTLPNLFCDHPPFQIDGNFGGAAGILEMLIQSSRDEIHILPALPEEWKYGSLKGVCLRGGLKADLLWREGRLEALEITRSSKGACDDKTLIFHYSDTGISRLFSRQDEVLRLTGHDFS